MDRNGCDDDDGGWSGQNYLVEERTRAAWDGPVGGEKDKGRKKTLWEEEQRTATD